MKKRRLVMSLLTAAAAAATATQVVDLPVGVIDATQLVNASSVSCFGDWCSGQDPQESGCSADAETVAWTDIEGARLELRWSPNCQTNWARYIQYERGWYIGNVPLEVRAVQDTGYTQRFSFGVNGAATGTYWSPMIYSPQRYVRAELPVGCEGAGDCLQGVLTGQNPIVTNWA